MIDPELRNELFVKLSGKFEVENAVEIGKDYKITATGTIVAVTEADKHDGTHRVTWKFVPTEATIEENAN